MSREPTTFGPRITAKFRPQAWVNDYAVDTGDPYEFDATDLLLSWPKERVVAIKDHSDEADAVWKEHPVCTVNPHDGPFEVEVAAPVAAFLDAVGDEYVWGDVPRFPEVAP
jgi:hypothetical protein